MARKKGLDEHYTNADGSPAPRKVERVLEPAPGTFGFDYSKYDPRRFQAGEDEHSYPPHRPDQEQEEEDEEEYQEDEQPEDEAPSPPQQQRQSDEPAIPQSKPMPMPEVIDPHTQTWSTLR